MSEHRRVARSWMIAAAVLAAASVATGCELADTVAPQLETRVVVHAVLNPIGTQQLVLVEKTLRSSVLTSGQPTRDAIAGARVVVYGPRADSSVAIADGTTAGVYRMPSVTISDGSPGTAAPNVLRIRPGERYRLRVETPLGVVTGETTVPTGGPVDAVRRTFNVDRDTLRLNVAQVRNAAGYLLRHESRFNVEERYKASLDGPLVVPLALARGDPEDEKWEFNFARRQVLPGLSQNFIVVAVDSNYFRYYVAGFDPFGDDTRGNSLSGGVGMFGSVATVMSKTLDLTADIDSPIEGSWTGDRNSAAMPATLTLYSSPYFPQSIVGGTTSVTGRARLFTGRALEAYGTINGAGVSFDFVDPAAPGTPVSAAGLLSGSTLVLTDSRTGERVTYRKP
ncbi:MAG TPA: DUF4249 family protein [Gemmatimonadaceae bacterium]|nr:DUF4249 family protein [Gemmatimonadaceae bacterium]